MLGHLSEERNSDKLALRTIRASMRTIKETFVPPVDYRYPFLEEK